MVSPSVHSAENWYGTAQIDHVMQHCVVSLQFTSGLALRMGCTTLQLLGCQEVGEGAQHTIIR